MVVFCYHFNPYGFFLMLVQMLFSFLFIIKYIFVLYNMVTNTSYFDYYIAIFSAENIIFFMLYALIFCHLTSLAFLKWRTPLFKQFAWNFEKKSYLKKFECPFFFFFFLTSNQNIGVIEFWIFWTVHCFKQTCILHLKGTVPQKSVRVFDLGW
jgi:hypothetical protein